VSALKQEICKNGHSMDEYRKFHPNGDSYCSKCKADRTKKSHTLFPEKHSRYSWKSRIKKMYGITEKQYSDLFISQEGKCGICKEILEFRGKQTHIDHNHVTLEVRGLLCHSCNTGLGLFKDNEETMQNAIEYLQKDKK
jgi:hypothetical protein